MNAGKVEDEDLLLDELDELEAEMAQAQLEDVHIGVGALISGEKPPIKAQQKPLNEKEELEALEKLMS